MCYVTNYWMARRENACERWKEIPRCGVKVCVYVSWTIFRIAVQSSYGLTMSYVNRAINIDNAYVLKLIVSIVNVFIIEE